MLSKGNRPAFAGLFFWPPITSVADSATGFTARSMAVVSLLPSGRSGLAGPGDIGAYFAALKFEVDAAAHRGVLGAGSAKKIGTLALGAAQVWRT